MAFWIFMLIIILLVPMTMIGFGKMFSKRAPQNINPVFGYRTAMSMKNQDTWVFAHRFCGKLWFRLGFALLPLSVIPFFFVLFKETTTVAYMSFAIVMLQLIPMVGTIWITEAALKKTFDQDGIRR